MAVKYLAASVLTRLKNLAKADKISFQMVLQLLRTSINSNRYSNRSIQFKSIFLT